MDTATQENTAVQAVNTEATQLRELPLRKISTFEIMSDPILMERVNALAVIMASGKVTTPKHLQENVGDCAAVIMQSMQWGMSHVAVAQKTHLINGALGYEAQLVNAVIMESGAIDGHFHYEFQGDGASLACRVGARVRGSSDITWGEWLKSSEVTTKNSPLWKSNPKQQMGYLQVKNWARLYFPGAILGVYTADELQDMEPKDINGGRAKPRNGAAVAEATQSGVVIDQEQEERRNGLITALEEFAKKGSATFTDQWKKVGRANKDDIYLVGEAEYNRMLQLAIDADEAKTKAAETTGDQQLDAGNQGFVDEMASEEGKQ
jgi:hypothetical protein